MEFVCKIGTAKGEIEERRCVADDATSLRTQLEREGHYVFSVRRAWTLRGLTSGRRRIRQETLRLFAQELATLLKAGLPLLHALEVMIERQQETEFRRSLVSIHERITSGGALSDAVRAEGALYPPMFAASLVAGERSGSLDTVLRRLAQYLRLSEAVKRKALAAAVYPAFLVGVMVTVTSILLVFVIPRFEDFYSGLGAQLPLATRVLVAIGRNLQQNLLLLGIGAATAAAVTTIWWRRPGSAAQLDRVLLRVPALGHLMRIYATSQLARTLSTLLAGGLPLLDALDVAGDSVGNRAVGQAILRATPLIREGKSLTAALESTGHVENLALEMVRVGEQTGALADMLGAIAEFYDEELESRMATTMALIEPVMVVTMAVLVTLMLLAFYLPLFQSFLAVEQRGL